MSLTDDIKFKLARLNVLEKIIAINIVVFLFALLFKPFLITVFGWFELPSDFYSFLVQPWTIISYAFLHYDFLHLLFNMLWLYFIGRLFLNLFNPKMALNVYFLGAIVGGLLFLTGYNLVPSFFKGNASLVGASAAVRALMIFLCAYMPNKEIRFFTFNLKLWYVGAALVVFDVLGVFGISNAGGNLAHLGGALLGYVYAKQLEKGNDIGRGFERIVNTIMGWFKPKNKNLKTVHKSKSKVGGYTKGEFGELNKQKQIDTILDKISKSGYESLTSEEKDFLFRAGK